MAAANTSFFDVLIDQLIEDVRREFEAPVSSSEPSPFDEPKKVYAGPEDMVSRMIGYRSRQTAPAPTRRSDARSLAPSPRSTLAAVAVKVAPHERAPYQPKFETTATEIAFQLVTRAGARFYSDDFEGAGFKHDALKRERRRVLLTLHPDRVPESDRANAHERFLGAAEAFTVLADASQTGRRSTAA